MNEYEQTALELRKAFVNGAFQGPGQVEAFALVLDMYNRYSAEVAEIEALDRAEEPFTNCL